MRPRTRNDHYMTRALVLRARRRAGSAGFSLIELMVVVVLIAILTALAVPTMSTARDDRLCFDFARRIQGLVHHARTRAAARGAAHLIVFDFDAGGAGRVVSFEALDGDTTSAGPNPVSSCKLPANTWAGVSGFTPGWVDATKRAAVVEGVNLNGATGGIKAIYNLDGTAITSGGLVVCITPAGSTYFGTGNDVPAAIAAMQGAQPGASTLLIDVQRHNGAGAGVGLTREVIITSGSQPRIHSK